jgi:hypothetical protein
LLTVEINSGIFSSIPSRVLESSILITDEFRHKPDTFTARDIEQFELQNMLMSVSFHDSYDK